MLSRLRVPRRNELLIPDIRALQMDDVGTTVNAEEGDFIVSGVRRKNEPPLKIARRGGGHSKPCGEEHGRQED